ncbi:uncharacterized protein At2g39910 isoform X2 [Nymphaea colorata]|nr:uncharacterized protein At2g39910 isoform X2 [Nymphaea colorata]XP_049936300.1 uncharacterized protein At2g39910 isoform X2 [Nymphaea colorata]XP_049936301.1 uncharacterized protein At2g39910 isoform X2 [Nymphaea colorata]
MRVIRDFYLCCSALASADGGKDPTMSWVPKALASLAFQAIRELSRAIFCDLDQSIRRTITKLNDEFLLVPNEDKLVLEMMPIVFPMMKHVISDSLIDAMEDTVVDSCARASVGSAIVASHCLRWSIERVSHPYLGKLCSLVIPSVLTALDHWSPAVKGQAIISFLHIAKNMNMAELDWYADVILDACCRNIPANDDIWHSTIEMTVLLVTCTQRRNPRCSWYEKVLNEMLGHLERHPRSKGLRVSWLQLIEPVFNAMGVIIVAHFRRIFPLIFKWLHADDDKTVLLSLERLQTILKLTWMRNTLYVGQLVDELALTYKEASLRKDREIIRRHILQIFFLLQKSKGLQFEGAWAKHKDDPNLTSLSSSFSQGWWHGEDSVLSLA